ncbi:hypothetical protein GIB67_006973 [Kingdonia uniflora]|uniref:Uncharacterized protein n=1 Tax=Kingdonia uniflora TaxID=39325 RepID=A0A7J7NZF2_9MAGN|nr:hypothetical protein GIB67_006973 [Kingdonia uniflora]
MTPVQIDITRKTKGVVENLGTTNNLNPRGLCRSAQPEIVQEEHNLSPGEEATSEASNQPTHNFKHRKGPNKCKIIATENYLRRPLEYNLLGQPVGEDSVGYNTYLGVIVREQKFIVPDEARKLALMTMGKDWHEHKVQKRKVIDIEDDLEQALANYPEDVPCDQWEVFAEQCTTSEYKHQIDIGGVDLTVLFDPELTGRVRVTGFGISPMVYNSVQQSGVLVQSLQEEPNQISAQDETTLPESNRLASVSIQIALKEDVPLARGNDHLKTIEDACGSFVAWPAPFIINE